MGAAAAAGTLDRRGVVADLVAGVPDALIVAGLGSPSYDLFAAGDRELNFYLWGAMGAAVPMGLGLALAQPERSVVVLTGDGEQLMGVGSLAAVGARRPANLSIVVLDNGHYGETGMQPSHTSLGTDLIALAAGFGIPHALRVSTRPEVTVLRDHVLARSGPTFAQVLISPDEPPRTLPPRDGVHLKNRFRGALGLPPF
ncbi:MAG TPA: thiamine pyrophosphate-dependent enzyme [Pseudonocardia sp.]|jgi:phosphonopyruvate decarboxylase|uniref:thiamine pyrophosphate-dependent enzyme n=1 Tax=Pseudonocardia sp. TaxID=60912 RepID=UPI002ED8A727